MAPPIQHAPPTSTHIGHNCASGCTTHRHSGGISTLLTFMVVLSGRFSVPPQQTKQALAISTECVYNARVFVVGHVWKHGRIYLFRKNMVRLGWGNYAFKQARMGMSTPETDLRRCFSEQLNAHSEQLNATMRHHGTELVAFTLGSHPKKQNSNFVPISTSANPGTKMLFCNSVPCWRELSLSSYGGCVRGYGNSICP